MKRRLAYVSLLLAAVCGAAAGPLHGFEFDLIPGEFGGAAEDRTEE